MSKVATQVKCRLFEEKDMQGILTLWERYSGWGGITEQQYYDWFINQPYGRCLIIIAEDDSGEIIGQTIFTPTQVYSNGQYINALRLAAPIVKDDAREYSLRSEEHPAFKMITAVIEIGANLGYSLTYSFPAKGWLLAFKTFFQKNNANVVATQNECYAIAITEGGNITPPNDLTISPVDHFDETFDTLWEEAVMIFPIQNSVVRNRQWLSWKLGGHLVLALKSNNGSSKLLGYIAINKKTGLIVDVFGRNSADIQKIITNTVVYLYKLKNQNVELPFSELKIMKSFLIKDILDSPLFYKIDYDFAFVCYLLNNNLKNEDIQADSWFMMPND